MIKHISCFFALACMLVASGCDYDTAFKMSEAGTIDIIEIPQSTILQTTVTNAEYFTRSNDLFMRLFNYIDQNSVSMTTPVEGGISNAYMNFYVGAEDAKKDLKDKADVTVRTVPARKVVRIGGTGAYSRENLVKSEARLLEWLTANTNCIVTGQAYGVFWNSPFTPDFMKRYEVHIPVSVTAGTKLTLQ